MPQIITDLPLIHSLQIVVVMLGLQFLDLFVTKSQELANVSRTFMANNVKGKRSVAEITSQVYNKVVYRLLIRFVGIAFSSFVVNTGMFDTNW